MPHLGTTCAWEGVDGSRGLKYVTHNHVDMARQAESGHGPIHLDPIQRTQSTLKTGQPHVAGAPQVLSSLHVIWGHSSYPRTGAHLVVGVDLVQILHSEVRWAGALGSLFCDHSLGDRRVGGRELEDASQSGCLSPEALHAPQVAGTR